ncbi:hypothetical protein H0H81_008668, partial [Sphagnurus paluster]
VTHLVAGNHKLKVEVLSLAEWQMSLMLDHIVYTPLTDALAALPTAAETFTAPSETPAVVPVPVPTVDESTERKDGGVPIAAVLGGAADAVLTIALFLLLYGAPVTSWGAFIERGATSTRCARARGRM